MPELKIEDIHRAVAELRDEVEKKGASAEKIDKIGVDLEAYEVKNQEIARQQAIETKRAEELKEQVDSLELELAKASNNTVTADHRQAPEYKALNRLITHGIGGVDAETKALLRTDVDTAGGYLTTSEMDPSILKEIEEISGVRAVSRVRQTASKVLEMAKRTKILVATYEGEAELAAESVSEYGSDSIYTHRQSVVVPITQDQLMNSAFNMESEIFSDSTTAFAQGEGRGFVVGTGVKQPEGFTQNATVQANALASGAVGVLSGDDVIKLTGQLKAGHNPTYGFNRATLVAIRILKDSQLRYLWEPGLNGMAQATLNGIPYVIMQDMPDIATAAYPVVLGDFLRGYQIVDRTGMSVIRDDVTAAGQGIVKFTLARWNTGSVVQPEAIQLLQIA